ncbi:MAG: S9 family peptidase [Candidatus Aminicenantales bacterium]
MKNFRLSAKTLAILLLLAGLPGSRPAAAQVTPRLQDWMRRLATPEFSPARGGGGRWLDGGAGYLTTERNAAGAGEIVRYETSTGKREVWMSASQLTPPELGRLLVVADYALSASGTKMIFAVNPRPTMIRKTAFDYWVLDRTDGSWRKLAGNAPDGVLYAKLSPDGTRAAYVRENNIYVENVPGGTIRPLTSDGSETIINGTSDWVYEEEFGLGDGFAWSPDGRKIAYFQFDQTGVPEFALINYTDTLYPVITKYRYPKAGQTNSAVRIGVVDAAGGPTVWLKTPGNPRDNYIARMAWAGNSREVILQHLNRLQNTNAVLLGDAETGDTREMFRDRDEAWVDVNEEFVWIDGGRNLLFVSERDGWRHAYAVTREGAARLITTSPFDLISVSGIDEANGWLYFIASPDNATQRYLYRSRLNGSATERVTPAGAPGTHTYDLSPDGRWAFHDYSTFDAPGTSDLVRLPDHRAVRIFADNAELRAKVKPILAGRTEMLRVPVDDGVVLDGWLIRPGDFDPAKKYPIIIYVYGEPAATTVSDSWGYGRLLSAALADEGYLVASFDNRGTPAPKGRAWRKVVYGAVGVLASKEQAAAVRALAAARPYVDLTRVGVYGWSGGGSMTLNLMFRSPDLFKVGVAGAPVPDQTLYDSIYQERYMGLPGDNARGYHDGSPISFAEGLAGRLLIIHGTGDDNVHFQGTQRLLNRLIELDKPFHFMEYPNRRHGIRGPHLENLRYGFLLEYLPAGGR